MGDHQNKYPDMFNASTITILNVVSTSSQTIRRQTVLAVFIYLYVTAYDFYQFIVLKSHAIFSIWKQGTTEEKKSTAGSTFFGYMFILTMLEICTSRWLCSSRCDHVTIC